MQQNNNNKYRSFEEARAFALTLGIKTREKWEEYCKSGLEPEDILSNPDVVYGNPPRYRSFREARAFVDTLGLKSKKEWEDYCKSGDKPDDIPSNPDVIYGNFHKNVSDKTIPPIKTLKQTVKNEIYLMDNREFRTLCKWSRGWYAIFNLKGEFEQFNYGGASRCYSVRVGEGGVYTKKDLYKKICKEIDYGIWLDAENERRSQE